MLYVFFSLVLAGGVVVMGATEYGKAEVSIELHPITARGLYSSSSRWCCCKIYGVWMVCLVLEHVRFAQMAVRRGPVRSGANR